jgi:hypothetical protein
VDASLRQPAAPDDDGVVTRAHTAREVTMYGSKLVRCSTSTEVATFLRGVT